MDPTVDAGPATPRPRRVRPRQREAERRAARPAGRIRLGGVGLGVLVLVLAAVLVVTMAVAVAVGSVSIPIGSVLEVAARRMHLGHFTVTVLNDQIVWDLRLPRVLAAAATGAGLSICGAILQSLTRNPLAEPYLLGVSGGAAVGAVSVIVFGVGIGLAGMGSDVAMTVGAFLGALGALALVLMLATGRSGQLPPARVILAGVAIGQIASAYTSFIVIVRGTDPNAARSALMWMLGSFAGVRWTSAVFVMIVTVAALAGFLAFSRDLDAFAFGARSARSLGISVTRIRWTLMAGTALLTACLVAVAGAIGFVGLVVPHIVRLVTGPGHVRLLPLSALAGAILLVWSDLFARSVVAGQEIPIGVVTAALGAPFFIHLLRRSGRAE